MNILSFQRSQIRIRVGPYLVYFTTCVHFFIVFTNWKIFAGCPICPPSSTQKYQTSPWTLLSTTAFLSQESIALSNTISLLFVNLAPRLLLWWLTLLTPCMVPSCVVLPRPLLVSMLYRQFLPLRAREHLQPYVAAISADGPVTTIPLPHIVHTAHAGWVTQAAQPSPTLLLELKNSE